MIGMMAGLLLGNTLVGWLLGDVTKGFWIGLIAIPIYFLLSQIIGVKT